MKQQYRTFFFLALLPLVLTISFTWLYAQPEVITSKEKEALAASQKNNREWLKKNLEAIKLRQEKARQRITVAGLSPYVLAYLKQNQKTIDSILRNLDRLNLESPTAFQIEILELEEAQDAISFPERQIETDGRYKKLKADEIQSRIVALKTEVESIIEIGYLKENLQRECLKFSSFIGQRLLWTRSHQPLLKTRIKNFDREMNQLMRKVKISTHPLSIFKVGFIFILILLIFLVAKSKIRQPRPHIAVDSMKGLFINIAIFTLFTTCAFALIFFLQKLVSEGGDGSPLIKGLVEFAPVYTSWLMVCLYFTPRGLFQSIFPEGEDSIQVLKKGTQMLFFAGPFFIVSLILDVTEASLLESVARWSYFIAWIIIAFITIKTVAKLSKTKGDLSTRRDLAHGTLHRFLVMVLTPIPLIISGLVILGYQESAYRIETLAIETLFVIAAWMALLSVFWHLRQYMRRHAFDDAREHQQENEVDFKTLRAANESIANIFRFFAFAFLIAGLWVIWKDLFAAFNFMKHISLWSIEKDDPFTLLDLCLVFFIIYGMFVIHKNLRNTLDIYIFTPLGLTQGNRYAITMVLQYIIFFSSTAFIFDCVGLGWSKIQWLAAAFSVGLGFGLQEIFANFVSGIILLFERPVRVGDIISVEEFWGTIQKINIRSTTILNWDRQEVIIPNKELVTGRLINWTLSDKDVRIIIKVGVSYSSDIDKAKGILLDIAEKHPKVCKTPEPMVAFMEFADSSLNLEMDIYISDLHSEDDLDEVRDAVNCEILARFRSEGIQIPFPQRDLHIIDNNGVKSS